MCMPKCPTFHNTRMVQFIDLWIVVVLVSTVEIDRCGLARDSTFGMSKRSRKYWLKIPVFYLQDSSDSNEGSICFPHG